MSSRNRPSPALVLSLIAIVLAAGGSAVAASTFSKSEVKQIKKIAKKQGKKQGKKQAKKQIRANLNGVRLRRIFTTVPNNGTPATVIERGGLRLRLSCAGGDYALAATSLADNSRILVRGNASSQGQKDFDAGGTLNNITSQDFGDQLDISFIRPGGGGITGTILVDRPNVLNADICAVSGVLAVRP